MGLVQGDDCIFFIIIKVLLCRSLLTLTTDIIWLRHSSQKKGAFSNLTFALFHEVADSTVLHSSRSMISTTLSFFHFFQDKCCCTSCRLLPTFVSVQEHGIVDIDAGFPGSSSAQTPGVTDQWVSALPLFLFQWYLLLVLHDTCSRTAFMLKVCEWVSVCLQIHPRL